MVTTLNGNTRNRLMTFSYHTKLLLWCCCSRKAKIKLRLKLCENYSHGGRRCFFLYLTHL